MTERKMFWAAVSCAALMSGQAYAQVQAVVVRPSPVHLIPDDPAADDANPILNPAAAAGSVKVVQVKLVEVQPAAALLVAAPEATPAVLLSAAPVASVVDAGPKVAVARRIVDAAGAFDGYMHRAAAIKADFADGDAVARAVTLGAVYQPGQLEQGAVAFAALLALQDPAFVRAVQDVGADPRGRQAFSDRLVAEPKAVLEAPAARRAAARVAGVLGRMGVDLVAAGAAVKQAAYDVQRQGWSRQPILAADTRLATLRAQSARSVSLAPADTSHLIADLAAMKTAAPDRRPADEAGPVVTRGLAVAALAVLGEAGEDDAERVAPLLTEPVDAQCIKMAQLNLMQCLAVAGPHYENAFCLGRHAMMDTGQCVATAAGLTAVDLKPAVDTRSVMVPIAVAAAAPAVDEEAGTERNEAFGAPPPKPVQTAALTPPLTLVRDDVAVPVAMAQAAPPPPEAPAYSPYDGPGEK